MSNQRTKFIIISIVLFSGTFFGLPAHSATTMGVTPSAPGVINLNRGLVGHWTFDGKDVFSTKVLDESGNGNDGAKTGNILAAKGKLGQALKFTVGSFVSAADAIIDTSGAHTYSIWAKPDSLPVDRALIGDWAGEDNGTMLYSVSADQVCAFVNWTQKTCVLNIASGVWHHYVLVDDNTNVYFYMDGQRVGTVLSTTNDGANLSIGTYAEGAASSFLGALDDVRVYNRALSAKEVQSLYQTGAGTKQNVLSTLITSPLQKGLVGYWAFDGKDVNATQVLDKSGSDNHGAKVGSVSAAKGKLGQAMKFNGASDCVILNSTITLGNGNWTVSTWVKTSTGGTVMSNSSGGPVTNEMGVAGDGRIFYSNYDGGWNSNFGTAAINDGIWHHLTWVNFSNQTMNMYVDGKLEAGGFGSFTTNGGPVNSIGKAWEGHTAIDGYLDEFRVYSRALSAKEIKQLYSGSAGGKVGDTVGLLSPGASLKKGLVGHWTFDGKDTGVTYTLDKSGYGGDGSRQGGVAAVKGKIGQAMKFDGGDDYINVGDRANLSFGTGNFSVSSWIKPDGPQDIIGAIVNKYSGPGYFISLNAWTPRLFLSDGVGGYLWENCGTTQVAGNAWSHLVFIMDRSSNARCYINGVQTGIIDVTSENGNLDTASDFSIGHEFADDRWFKGLIDEVRMYNRALTKTEIQQLYQMGK